MAWSRPLSNESKAFDTSIHLIGKKFIIYYGDRFFEYRKTHFTPWISDDNKILGTQLSMRDANDDFFTINFPVISRDSCKYNKQHRTFSSYKLYDKVALVIECELSDYLK